MHFDIGELDHDMLEDFLTALYESLESMEHDLTVLERDQKNEKAIHNLVLGVNQLKSHCRMCCLDPFVNYLNNIEALFLALRSGHLECTHFIRETSLLALDTLRQTFETLIQVDSLSLRSIVTLGENIYQLAHQNAQDADEFAIQVMESMASFGDKSSIGTTPVSALAINEESIGPSVDEVHDDTPVSEAVTSDPYVHSVEADLKYFKSLAENLEERYLFWKSRSKRTLSLALSMNRCMGNCVDPTQLTAAVFVHDVGMVFIPDEIVNKSDRLNYVESKLLKQHPRIGYDLLIRMPGWTEAADMVYAHHERPDGQGYPKGLKGNEIPVGAQILAVVDTYFSITRERADRLHKKSLLRAVKEIMFHVDKQFSTEVVHALITVISQLVNQEGYS